ncbi:MAG: hypothetical protein AAF433_07020 [Bacteroidota bacterium]
MAIPASYDRSKYNNALKDSQKKRDELALETKRKKKIEKRLNCKYTLANKDRLRAKVATLDRSMSALSKSIKVLNGTLSQSTYFNLHDDYQSLKASNRRLKIAVGVLVLYLLLDLKYQLCEKVLALFG